MNLNQFKPAVKSVEARASEMSQKVRFAMELSVLPFWERSRAQLTLNRAECSKSNSVPFHHTSAIHQSLHIYCSTLEPSK